MAKRRRLRVRLWISLGVLGLVGLLYVQPLRTYLETRDTVARRAAEVQVLTAERARLERRLAAQTGTAALLREARRLALVKPGERLYIVKGIPAWRREHAATLAGDG